MPTSAAKAESRAIAATVEDLLRSLDAGESPVKFGASKGLRMLSESQPETLYPYFDRLAKLLDSDNSFLRWDATRALANLAAVDHEKKLDALLARFLSPIPGPQMIGAATAIAAAANIALAKPYLADRIAEAILQVQTATYQTVECRHIAIGHAIESLGRFIHLVKDRQAVVDFVSGQVANPRNATRNKALKFMAHRRS